MIHFPGYCKNQDEKNDKRDKKNSLVDPKIWPNEGKSLNDLEKGRLHPGLAHSDYYSTKISKILQVINAKSKLITEYITTV